MRADGLIAPKTDGTAHEQSTADVVSGRVGHGPQTLEASDVVDQVQPLDERCLIAVHLDQFDSALRVGQAGVLHVDQLPSQRAVVIA